MQVVHLNTRGMCGVEVGRTIFVTLYYVDLGIGARCGNVFKCLLHMSSSDFSPTM